MPSLFRSSGDLIADRRYEHARALAERGDLAAAADLFAQAVERVPAFASAWFALGETRERLADDAGATDAYRAALTHDPQDRHGAGLKLARLAGDVPPPASGYVRALFDQYAPQFDDALRSRLNYRGPELLRDAISVTAGARVFARMIDLGCGTGLMAEAMRGRYAAAVGVDLSPAMIEEARRKGLYDELIVAEMSEALAGEPPAAADLVVAADSFVYLADLAPLCAAAARVLERNGMLAFTVEAGDAHPFVLQPSLRYAHSRAHVAAAIGAAGLDLVCCKSDSTRDDAGAPVPGLVVVAVRP